MSNAQEQQIEQLVVELEGSYGFLNEIILHIDQFLPILRCIPQVDKFKLQELEKRILIAKQTLSMRRNNPATIVSSMGF